MNPIRFLEITAWFLCSVSAGAAVAARDLVPLRGTLGVAGAAEAAATLCAF
jgi:hypothetical protein